MFTMEVANGRKKFAGATADLWVTGEVLPFQAVTVVSRSKLEKWARECNFELTPETIREYGNDATFGHKLPEGLLVGSDYDENLYLNYRGHSVMAHQDGKRIVFVSEHRYDLRGPGLIPETLKAVPLEKFRSRHYPNGQGDQSTFEVTPYSDALDTNLLVSWAIHQFIKLVFPVVEEPFHEIGGLIHRKFVYRWKDIYKVPETFDFHAFYQSLQVSERHHDRDNFSLR